MAGTVASLVGRSLVAYETLAGVGEVVDDEWQYLQDLGTVWRARLSAVATARGDEPASPEAAAAVDAAIAEIGRITDPHRAIDWLSTFPQVVLYALGEDA